MTEAEKAAKMAAAFFWGSVATFVLAGATYFLALQFQPPPTGMGSQRSLVSLSVGWGIAAWFQMMMAYRKLLKARRAESEAVKSLSETPRTDQSR
jgi:hypothetical protein